MFQERSFRRPLLCAYFRLTFSAWPVAVLLFDLTTRPRWPCGSRKRCTGSPSSSVSPWPSSLSARPPRTPPVHLDAVCEPGPFVERMAPNSTFFTSLPRTMGRVYHNVAEHLVEHVPVQRHFTLRGEVGLPSSLGHHALIHKLQALRHLAQREDLLHPSQFSLFKRSTELFVKIVLREREIWCNLSKISIFVIVFLIIDSPDFCFPTAIGGIFHSDIKDTKNLTIYQSICYKVFNNSRLPLFMQAYSSRCLLSSVCTIVHIIVHLCTIGCTRHSQNKFCSALVCTIVHFVFSI